ncbi:MAG TPA: lamin tail domain-containing protein, partial [Bacillota bacterium]|nr:lamin tail domain-containing protein [Bacillota bacterium]
MKRLVSFLLVFTLALSIIPVASAAGGTPIINQVYGGGGKGETPIANSFVELYNPGDAAVSLTGYTLVYGKKTLALTGEIPANGSYLIVGKAEDTSDEFLTYDLPAADQTCNWEISNKKYTIQLKNGDTVIDSVTADENGATKVSKQKSLRRKEYADTDTDADFQTIFWEKASCVLDDDYLDAYAPRNSAGERGGVHNAEPPEQVYT